MKMIINYHFVPTMEKELMETVFGSGDIQFYVNDESKNRLREAVASLEYKEPVTPPNTWTVYAKQWGKEHSMNYWQAIRHPECKKDYRESKRGK